MLSFLGLHSCDVLALHSNKYSKKIAKVTNRGSVESPPNLAHMTSVTTKQKFRAKDISSFSHKDRSFLNILSRHPRFLKNKKIDALSQRLSILPVFSAQRDKKLSVIRLLL